MATVNSTASTSNKNKTIHRKVFCSTHSLLSLPSRMYGYNLTFMNILKLFYFIIWERVEIIWQERQNTVVDE